MLVLSRRIGEKIDIGDGITVTVLKVTGKTIRLGIEAPDSVTIRRSEIAPVSSSPKPPETSDCDSTTLGSVDTASRF
ncbi:carbon storage regulator [Blastopirellula marina]|uniref:Translational regulator CsrA n=2 Tax=Blastopirellula marina TaxID=124 RepID=A0A2S8G0F8_9BACT|nr:carbon storage regulator [Blastopirellula marina]PQO37913.1 carbon storage regulator [Blastopirellula marina]PTL44569.1 carbon storage regulator [Blastopirellula marina]